MLSEGARYRVIGSESMVETWSMNLQESGCPKKNEADLSSLWHTASVESFAKMHY